MKRVGERIKKRRELLHLHLNELAEKVGISSSALSQIEKAKSSPSLQTLKSIADHLHTTVGELIGENESLQNNPIIRREEIKQMDENSSGARLFQLSHHDLNKQMDTFLLRLNPKSDSSDFFKDCHGHIFCHILKGEVQFKLNTETHTVTSGDNVYCNAKSSFSFTNNSQSESEILCVLSPPCF